MTRLDEIKSLVSIFQNDSTVLVDDFTSYNNIGELDATKRVFIRPVALAPDEKWLKTLRQAFLLQVEADSYANLETMVDNILRIPADNEQGVGGETSIAAVADDGFGASTDGVPTWTASAASWIGTLASIEKNGNAEEAAFLRFHGFYGTQMRPRSATLTVTSKDNYDAATKTVYGLEEINVDNFDDDSDMNGTKTTATATNTDAWVVDTEYEFDVTSIIQEIIDDTTGFTGPYIGLMIRMTTDIKGCAIYAYDTDNTNPTKYAKLTVSFPVIDLDILVEGTPTKKSGLGTWQQQMIIEGTWTV